MNLDVLIQGLGLGLVILLTLWDLEGSEARAVVRGRAVPAGGERRCPFCHLEFETSQDQVVARCASCGTGHHAGCWEEHGACCVFGCGCDQVVGGLPVGSTSTTPDRQGLTQAGRV